MWVNVHAVTCLTTFWLLPGILFQQNVSQEQKFFGTLKTKTFLTAGIHRLQSFFQLTLFPDSREDNKLVAEHALYAEGPQA